MSAPELKPCPFCGAVEVHTGSSTDESGDIVFFVGCWSCCVNIEKCLSWTSDAEEKQEAKERLVSQWNTRADLAPQEPDLCDGQWHGWNGGPCPVPGDTPIIAVLYDESNPMRKFDDWRAKPVPASDLSPECWAHNPDYRHVIAFRVIPHPPATPDAETDA